MHKQLQPIAQTFMHRSAVLHHPPDELGHTEERQLCFIENARLLSDPMSEYLPSPVAFGGPATGHEVVTEISVSLGDHRRNPA